MSLYYDFSERQLNKLKQAICLEAALAAPAGNCHFMVNGTRLGSRHSLPSPLPLRPPLHFAYKSITRRRLPSASSFYQFTTYADEALKAV